MKQWSWKTLAAVSLLSTLAAGCGPKVVGGIIARGDRVRFLHGDGIAHCDVPAPGEAKNCRDMNIQYQ